MKKIIYTFLLLATCSASASSYPWLKQETTDSLGLYVNASRSCPFNTEELAQKVRGEFVRSRIKPITDWDFFLHVTAHCMRLNNTNGVHTGYTVAYDIKFAKSLSFREMVLHETPDHRGIVVSGTRNASNYLTNTIRDSVSGALTDFLTANLEH